ncbi:endospore germination permease [Bacillus sp. 03113]|uniref:GerAB/ArcD/ProY family transporter n=1 Tax=Bacillus sp. 03113 TaxID=2578211 RepID=UPI0011433211|nr:endospore germination permease [Bacillus sp. 03113]
MLENGKISSRQLLILVILFNIGTTILLAPGSLASIAKQDAWIASLVGSGAGLLLVGFYILLGKLFPGLTLIQICEKVLGRWIGKFVSILYISYFFMICPFLLFQVGNFMATAIMPETPIEAIFILFMAIVIMGTRLGLETFTRSAEVFFPFIMLGLFILYITLSPQMQWANIQPIMEANIKTILKANYHYMSILYLQLPVFLMLAPFVNQKKAAGKALFWGTLIGGIITPLITFLAISVLGADMTSRNLFTTFALAKKIDIGKFLTRIEIILAGIWLLSIFFKLVICFYGTLLGTAQWLELKNYQVLAFPIGFILIAFTHLSLPNVVYFYIFSSKIWPSYTLMFGLFFPFLLLVVMAIRKIAK